MSAKKFCQSCGMPMKKDPQGGGTEKNGSKNTKFCSYCYQNGVFQGEGMTCAEYQEFCRKKMIERGCNKFLAWFFSRGYGRLERWKK